MNLPLLSCVLLAWACLCALVARGLAPLLPPGPARPLFQLVLFVALLPLVVADELLGQPQFEAACRQRSVLAWHGPLPAGTPLELSALPTLPVDGLLLPATARRWVYLNARSQAPVASYEVLRAEGGKLARLLADGSPARPLTFQATCGPTADAQVLAQLEASRLDRDTRAQASPVLRQ